jgi:hypothetical protein
MDRHFQPGPVNESRYVEGSQDCLIPPIFSFCCFTQEEKKTERVTPSAEWKIPPEEAQRQNPVKPRLGTRMEPNSKMLSVAGC